MAAVVPDVFGDLVKGLGQIYDAAVPVPLVDEVVDDAVFVFLTNQVIKHDFLVVGGQLLERNDFFPKSFDDLVTHLGVNVFGKVLQERLVLVLVEVFREMQNFVELQQRVKHVQQNVRFAEIAGSAD